MSGNSGEGAGGILFFGGPSSLVLENTIIAFSPQGRGLAIGALSPTVACCDIYGNEGGDWTGSLAELLGVDGNICADPLFCDPQGEDFTLDCNSPCAAENNPECGQIGAGSVGCGTSPSVRCTWGSLKAQYRH